ncbi:ABC transporter permease [Spirosoma sp. KUDC1026]|uniref:ABC transporter permease n=1 Tax=Spirosoma sp. KUDC1026 TaxID=2745947 RepID=UPI00159BB6AF|nr:ABC transporter permease [Spirosoma sp. KUDC1026]QKZ12804.1 ABC transporter permease [Spirosoma sp. KUDC1026]
MLQNYLKIALRTLRKNRVFSLINIAGLALGITAFVFILEYVAYERSFNQFHKNLPTLYRLLTQSKSGDIWSAMSPPVGPLAKEKLPEVRNFCRIAENSANGIVSFPEARSLQSFRESKLAYADASFFTLFTFPLIKGTATTALVQPNTVALSQSQAHKCFGAQNPIGQTLTLNNQFGKTLYTVTAVYADIPQNSDLSFDAVFALQTLANPANLNGNDWARLDSFYGTYLTTFLELPERTPGVPADYKALEAKINTLAKQRNPDEQNRFIVQPATTLHLASSLSDDYQTSGSLGFVYILSGIAGLVLLIAWFNYVNLSTAGALKRAKEVGVRKVIGAGPGQLIGQFLGESLLLNGLGFLLALLLVTVLQSSFNEFIQKDLSLDKLDLDGFWLVGLALLLIGAIASGGYVAFTMTSFQPIQTLKGTYQGGKNGWLRKTLVVAQFSASIALVIATLVLYRQLQYMQNKDLGVRLTQRVVIKGPALAQNGSFTPATAVLEDELSQLPYVKSFCQTSIVPGNFYNFTADGITKQNPRPGDDKKSYSMGIIDDRFLTTYEIKLIAGRNFTTQEAELGYEKSAKVMINETGARQLGFASAGQSVGQRLNWGQAFEIVGVIADYHHQGLQQAIQPVVFLPRRSVSDLTVQLTTNQVQDKLTQLEQLYKAAYPGNPFEFFFADENYNRQYQNERQYSRVFTVGSALAIFIACLGLFGLATFTTEQRTKEIGVRKVLGASVVSIVTLLSKDFLKLVFVAIGIASPLAYYGMHRWLQDFAYKVDITWWVFALAGLFAVGIAVLTVSLQSAKAALVNPVKSLRSE